MLKAIIDDMNEIQLDMAITIWGEDGRLIEAEDATLTQDGGLIIGE
jgi:hypothetical protein